MDALKFGRLIPAMITPFDENLELDLPRAQELSLRLFDGGCDSIVVCGTTGESPTVFYPQKMELFAAVKDAVGGKLPLIANVGDNCTADSVKFAREVTSAGIDGLMCVVPYYNKPPQEGLYRHFRTIAEAVPDTPIFLYNIPGRSVINMTAQTTLRLANDCPNIVAVKEASGDFDQIKDIIDGAPAGFSVYSGNDEDTLTIMELGGVGVISTIANVASARFKEPIEAFASGRSDEAKQLFDALLPLMRELFVAPNPIMVKEALKLIGFSCGGVRLPLVDATPEESQGLRQVLGDTGII